MDGSPSPVFGTHLARLSVMDEIMFHTLEFAQIITGALGREIARYGDQCWLIDEPTEKVAPLSNNSSTRRVACMSPNFLQLLQNSGF